MKFMALKMENHATFIADCIKAYYQAEQSEQVYVEAPAEYIAVCLAQGLSGDIVWALERMLPGQRLAGAGWVATASKKLETLQFERSA